MKRINKVICFILSFIILFSTAFVSLNISAVTKWYINATAVRIRSSASTADNSNILVQSAQNGTEIEMLGSTEGSDGYTWYKVRYIGPDLVTLKNVNIEGYVRSDLVISKEVTPPAEDKTFEQQLSLFPSSYHTALKELHAEYPNWKFHAENIDLTLEEAANLELGRKVISASDEKSMFSLYDGAYDWAKGTWTLYEKKWYYTSKEVIKYYMDPRNFLNKTQIYTFLQQSYNSETQNEDGLKKIIAGTFLEKGYPDENDGYGGNYIKVIMAAADKSKVNPYILAAKIILEQGVNGTSSLISGTYKGYEGYYNYFNVGASGSNVVEGGLINAMNRGWNSRALSIIGGAEFCGNNYVSAGQDTYYYMNFNIKEPNRIWHQYAASIQDASSKGSGVAKTYEELKSAELDFLIPVYKNTSAAASPLPDKNEKLNNYYFTSISVPGLTPSFEMYNYKYGLSVEGNATITVKVPNGASYVGKSEFNFTAGSNRDIVLTVKSQTGYTNDYIININAVKDCTLYIDSGGGLPGKVIMHGDTNGDGKINVRDLANVQMHILAVKALTGDSFIGGDTNGDGKINVRDLANIQMHILNIKLLT